jgi:hypothetical protein
MSHKIAGIDVHKKVLAVVVSDVEIESEYQFERRMFNSNPISVKSSNLAFGSNHRKWRARRDSNSRPSGSKPDALIR